MSSDDSRFRLLCGTWGSFAPNSGLAPLEPAHGNGTALETALKGLHALAEDAVLARDLSAEEFLEVLDEFVAGGGNIVIYLASRGLVAQGPDEFFRLATADTQGDYDPDGVLPIAAVIERLGQADANQRLLIVDAAYSGEAATSLTSGQVRLALPQDFCVLLSVDPASVGLAAANDALTPFTGGLSEALAMGLPGRGPGLSVRSLYSHLKERAEAQELPRPSLVSEGATADTITFRNAADPALQVAAPKTLSERTTAYEFGTEILYVDDEEKDRAAFAGELERAGHRVTLATGPDDAINILETRYFDIVVIDLLLVDDVPATEFIRECALMAPQSRLFLVSRASVGDRKLWSMLDRIFPHPNSIAAFFWKSEHLDSIRQHAASLRNARRITLSHVGGLDAAVPQVVERMIQRNDSLSDRSERLRLEVRACVERLVAKWFADSNVNDGAYVKSMDLETVGSGRSSSTVFKLVPTLNGIAPESVTPLILKLGPAEDVGEELARFDRYVQVGVPLDFRTDKVGSAVVGHVGGILYSYRGRSDNTIQEVGELGFAEIERCLRTVFDAEPEAKRWYASRSTGDRIPPDHHFKALGFGLTERLRAYDVAETTVEKNREQLSGSSPAASEPLEAAFEHMGVGHEATLVHGDLSLENLLEISPGRYAIIDYRTVGLGPRLVDFVTLEIACWLLARGPGLTRGQRFEDAVNAVPRNLNCNPVAVAPWLAEPAQLACLCRELAVANHKDASGAEYGALLWLAAIRRLEFRSSATSRQEESTYRALLPAIALAAQKMISSSP